MHANPFIGIVINDWSEPNSQFVDGVRIGLTNHNEGWRYRTFFSKIDYIQDYDLDACIYITTTHRSSQACQSLKDSLGKILTTIHKRPASSKQRFLRKKLTCIYVRWGFNNLPL